MIFTDASGNQWDVIDYVVAPSNGKKRKVPLGDWQAEGRAFVPVGREGNPMLFEFGRVAYRDTGKRTLEQQLSHAKPAGASPGERMQRND